MFGSLSSISEGSVESASRDTSVATKVRQGFAPLNGQLAVNDGGNRAATLKKLGGHTVQLETDDAIKLHAVWSKVRDEAPCVIICHGNGCTLDSMLAWAQWYHERKFSVLMFTIRGYSGSEGDTVVAGEMGLYLDAEAAIRYVRQTQKILAERVVAHGFSYGGSQAAHIAHEWGTHLVLDHRFTCAKDVTASVAKQISRLIPYWFARGIAGAGFPAGIQHRLQDGRVITTDGMHSEAKVQQIAHAAFIIYGASDELMPTAFADRFEAARQGNTKAMMPGGHSRCFTADEATSQALLEYLQRAQLL